MNIEEIKMDHFENFEELIKTCKMWIRDDDIDAYYRFFEFNCMKALLTAYEKEKEKNEELTKQHTIEITDVGGNSIKIDLDGKIHNVYKIEEE